MAALALLFAIHSYRPGTHVPSMCMQACMCHTHCTVYVMLACLVCVDPPFPTHPPSQPLTNPHPTPPSFHHSIIPLPLAPFFVMDEVDAALDNVNVRKVCSYIKYVRACIHTCVLGDAAWWWRGSVSACLRVCVSTHPSNQPPFPIPLLHLSLI